MKSPLIFPCLILKRNLFSWGACWYRTKPMSQNAHLTLEGNKKKSLLLSIPNDGPQSLWMGLHLPLLPSPLMPPSLHLLCSPQEVEHARAERRSRPWWPAIATVRIGKVIFSHVTQHSEGTGGGKWVSHLHLVSAFHHLQHYKNTQLARFCQSR